MDVCARRSPLRFHPRGIFAERHVTDKEIVQVKIEGGQPRNQLVTDRDFLLGGNGVVKEADTVSCFGWRLIDSWYIRGDYYGLQSGMVRT